MTDIRHKKIELMANVSPYGFSGLPRLGCQIFVHNRKSRAPHKKKFRLRRLFKKKKVLPSRYNLLNFNRYRCLICISQVLIWTEALLAVLLPSAQSLSRIPQCCSSLPPLLPSSWSGPAPLLPLHPPPFLFRPAEQLE